jgi:hypothetical protein
MVREMEMNVFGRKTTNWMQIMIMRTVTKNIEEASRMSGGKT